MYLVTSYGILHIVLTVLLLNVWSTLDLNFLVCPKCFFQQIFHFSVHQLFPSPTCLYVARIPPKRTHVCRHHFCLRLSPSRIYPVDSRDIILLLVLCHIVLPGYIPLQTKWALVLVTLSKNSTTSLPALTTFHNLEPAGAHKQMPYARYNFTTYTI